MKRRRFPSKFRAKHWFIRKIFGRLTPEIPSNALLMRILLQRMSFLRSFLKSFLQKSFLSSVSKSNAFFKTWISISESTLWLRLKTVLNESKPWRHPSLVTAALVDKPSDLTVGLPISCCASDSAFCKLIKNWRKFFIQIAYRIIMILHFFLGFFCSWWCVGIISNWSVRHKNWRPRFYS